MTAATGTLFVVATPIGNLADLSERQRATLAGVDLIAAEDTRHTGRLLAALGVRVPLLSLHEHNERRQGEAVLAHLRRGERVALVSDAGTPLISDPGYPLVHRAREEGHTVTPVPGPCAAVAALSVSGLPTDRFVFEGFLPARAAARRARLQELDGETRTLVFYESVHRIAECLADLRDVFGGDRRALLARELTKLHEQTLAGTLDELLAEVQQGRVPQKGEFVLAVAGAESRDEESAEAERVLRILLRDLPTRQAAELAAAITGAPRNALKRLAQTLSSAE